MDAAKYIAISSQGSKFKQLDVIANNVANANSTGFKAEIAMFNRVNYPGKGISQIKMSVSNNFTQGPINETGRPLDAAIDGKGFFVVQTELGLRYTRAGNFGIDVNGNLVDASGNPVMGEGNTPIVFDEADKNVEINEKGEVRARNGNGFEDRGVLSVVKFNNEKGMRKIGNSLFFTPEPPIKSEAEGDYRIVSAAMEGSNVNPITELTNMISVSRKAGGTSQLLNDVNELQRRAISTISRQN